MRRHSPLTRRTAPLQAADDRLHVWLIIQGWLVLWGLAIPLEPGFPLIFTRPFSAAALWPFVLLPRDVLALLILSGGIAVAVSCWVRVSQAVGFWLRLYGLGITLLLFCSYVWGGFPYAAVQFGVLLAVALVSYWYVPRGAVPWRA